MSTHGRGMIGRTLLATALFAANTAWALTYSWTNAAGGDFNSAGNWVTNGNWNPPGPPGPADDAVFNTAGTYRVTWSAALTNNLMTVRNGTLTLDTGAFTYGATNFQIGYNNSDVGDVIFTNGVIETRTTTYVGYRGNGNLTITNGAVWRHLGQGVGAYFMICNDMSSGGVLPHTNIVTVTGDGSLLSIGDRFYAGPGGASTSHYAALRILNGGRVDTLSPNNYLSHHTDIEVDGTNSLFYNGSSGSLWMRYGTNGLAPSISVTRGGRISVYRVTSDSAKAASVLVDGSGSEMYAYEYIAFGGNASSQSGDIQATVRNGGRVATTNLSVGNIYNWSNSVLTLENGLVATYYGYNTGLIRGSGTIDCEGRLMNSGTLSPGGTNVAGRITLTNRWNTTTYRQYIDVTAFGGIHKGGTLDIDLGGTNAASQYDVVSVGGSVLLSDGAAYHGTVTVRLMNGFRPKDGDTFDILTATGTITPSNDLSNLTFNMPAVPAKTTWSAAVTNIVGGRALRLTAHVAKAGGTVFMVQ